MTPSHSTMRIDLLGKGQYSRVIGRGQTGMGMTDYNVRSDMSYDAVVIDYRLLHGTHANTSASRRDCIILNFTPSWRRTPEDIKAHLLSHPAQPKENERVPISLANRTLLPTFSGNRKDLKLYRNAPRQFRVTD